MKKSKQMDFLNIIFSEDLTCNVPKTRQEDIPTHTASVVIKVTNILREDKTHHNHTVGQGNIL